MNFARCVKFLFVFWEGLATAGCAAGAVHRSGQGTAERGHPETPTVSAPVQPEKPVVCSGGKSQAEARLVALRDILDNPDRYLGVLVKVHAFAVLRFEASSLITSEGMLALEWTHIRFIQNHRACDQRVIYVEGRLQKRQWRGTETPVFIAESMTSTMARDE